MRPLALLLLLSFPLVPPHRSEAVTPTSGSEEEEIRQIGNGKQTPLVFFHTDSSLVPSFCRCLVDSSIGELRIQSSIAQIGCFFRSRRIGEFLCRQVCIGGGAPFPPFSNFYSTSIWFNSSSSLFAVPLPLFSPDSPSSPFNI